MSRSSVLTVIAAAVLVSACTIAPPPAVTPTGEQRFLIDPRTGYGTEAPESVQRRFDSAWRDFLAGDLARARRRFADLVSRSPEFLPAQLAQAANDISEGNLAAARSTVTRLRQQRPYWIAARVYEAEVAVAENRTREAYDIYRALATSPEAPRTAAERLTILERRLFEELYTAAQTAPDAESIRLLREALTLNAGATEARLLLARKLVAAKRWDEARATLEPLFSTADLDRPEVQETLAEIDTGRGRFQEAIIRYERLSRRTHEPRYARRLDEIKELWNAANMPPQFQEALAADAITRSDFAVLLYWKVTSVRFAQNLATPPIAIDIDVPARDEIIRAIALGLYDVDPVTRRVNPGRPITAGGLSRLLARVLTLRGATCARGIPTDRILETCSISDPTAQDGPDAPVSGSATAGLLDQIDEKLH